MKSKLTVGVTGGIGSGKSFICKILENMGYPVFYADQSAKSLLVQNSNLISEIKTLLGKESYNDDGTINRQFIASQIFGNDTKLSAMNALVHPAVRTAFAQFVSEQNSLIVFNEAAILFETGSYVHFDKTILVTAPRSTKIERILNRESITESEIEARMAKQWPDDKKIPLADFIVNNGNDNMLLPQLVDIIASLDKFNTAN